MDASRVAAAATLLDVLPVDAFTERLVEGVEEVRFQAAVVLVCDGVDVIAVGRVFDGVDGLSEDKVAIADDVHVKPCRLAGRAQRPAAATAVVQAQRLEDGSSSRRFFDEPCERPVRV